MQIPTKSSTQKDVDIASALLGYFCSVFETCRAMGQTVRQYCAARSYAFTNSLESGVVVTPGWYRLNRKALVFAAIFLALALIFPAVVIFEENAATTQSIINNRPNLNDETAVAEFLRQMQARENTFLLVLVVVEAVLVLLFAVSMWFALRSPHEKHLEHEVMEHDLQTSK